MAAMIDSRRRAELRQTDDDVTSNVRTLLCVARPRRCGVAIYPLTPT
ncbi:hypothetical protein [Mycolicibacterium farcinogenes]|uniref:Uncharacterized protein n=1 Tax=Mycolicibacterium farcinogenes TaxID=1802 RepID=A0ACD1FQP8_MYCFR|nr:hypothetical protein [Mycolicibacterium farcinogenes]QZH69398.1 hypothetical protein K6L26_30850 [Mycolicibacterium farcinogenes]